MAGNSYAPDHKLQSGQRYFTDLTKEKARAIAVKRVEDHWDDGGEYPIKDFYDTKNQAVEMFANDFYGTPPNEGKQPTIEIAA